MFKKPKLWVDILKCFMYTAAANIMSLIVVMYTANWFDKIPVRIIVGAATIFMLCGLIFNFANNAAKRDRIAERNLKIPHDTKKIYVLSAAAATPEIICLLLLILAKYGIGFENMPAIYKLLTAYFMPITDFLFHQPEFSLISAGDLVVLFTLSLIPAVVSYITYRITYNDIDVKKKLMYD